MKRKKARYVLFILLQSLVYGIGNPLTKLAYATITPLWLLAARFLLAFGLLLALFGRRIVAQARQAGWRLWLPGSLCCAGAYISCNLALNLTAATNVGFLMSLPVLFAPALAAVTLGRRYDLRRLPVQALMVAGLFLLCCNGGAFSFGWGEALALLDALCLAGMLVFGEKALKQMDVLAVTALQIGVTAAISLLGAVCFDDPAVLARADTVAWGTVVYLALICSIAAYLLQNAAVNHLSAGTVSMLQCTQPILTAAVSYVLLRETLTGWGLVGAAVIVACLAADSWLDGRGEKTQNRG